MIESKYKYEGVDDDHLKDRTKEFYENNKEHLKEKNDWNKPLDNNKCVSYKITNQKILGENIFSFNVRIGQVKGRREFAGGVKILSPISGILLAARVSKNTARPENREKRCGSRAKLRLTFRKAHREIFNFVSDHFSSFLSKHLFFD